MDQNNDSSGFDQIQTPQYPVIHPPSQEMSEEHAQSEDTKELFPKLIEDLQIINKELAEYINSPKKEKLPPDFDIRQLDREECCIKVCREQKQNMEDTMLELVEVCHQKELYCMHNNVDDLIESALNSKLLLINLNSQRLDKEQQKVKSIVEQPTKCGTRINKSLQNFRVVYKKSSTSLNITIIPETESGEVIKSSVKNFLPIPSEYEVTSDDESECEFDYLEEFSGALMPTSIVDEERIRREHKKYISRMEKLFTINPFPRPTENFHANTIIKILPTSPIPVEDSDSQREEIDIFTGTDNLLLPGIESDDYDSEGEIYVLEELLVDDSIPLPINESSNFDHQDDPSLPRPPPEPPDVEFFFYVEPDSGELISVVKNNNDELNEDCWDLTLRDDIDGITICYHSLIHKG
uniref:Reverse transcriptase domain-containing protein n=1 Tax=Tanacetum cinerariifolium TaxID=118510 RepID=A0A6L2NJH4_TANCI|nr:hypothetical protein [Tanacetum cinerariifolium]